MKDVQSAFDPRGIDLQKVGVKDVHVPLLIQQRDGGTQQVLGCVRLAVDLPRHYKGTHMSRFLEVLMRWSTEGLSSRRLRVVLEELRDKLQAERAEIQVSFKYFLPKRAPVSGSLSVLDYDCEFAGFLEGGHFDFRLGVELPVTSVCPCSREISAYGAHNQRAVIRVRCRFRPGQYLWIEDLIALVEQQGSEEVYPLLKREDEKYVTEHAFDNPKFVEDILRDVVAALRREPRVVWFEAECESYESIHNHSTFAYHVEQKGENLRPTK
ncbi:MAG: GTP cyclohydrolase FolE2 [Bacillota bacterium]|nr:GTP cyclohydrolase FolE2 [Bacillota bacterium]